MVHNYLSSIQEVPGYMFLLVLILSSYHIIKIVQLVGRFKATDAGRLRAEYNRLVEGLALSGDLSGKYIVNQVMCGLVENTQI